MSLKTFSLLSDFVHLRPDGAAEATLGGDAFWRAVGDEGRRYPGRVAMVLEQTADWPTWERHPAGEELILALSGEVELIAEIDGARSQVTLSAGSAVLMPAGVWHTAIVHAPGALLFVTPGDGTQTRPVTESLR